jgi:phospholipid/cholesterol/gamma-HCH transport system ATP-binding protein
MLYGGKIIEQGSPEELKNSGNEIVRQFLEARTEGPIPVL